MTSAWPTLPGRLGADVAFFLHGGCALLGGVGEVLQRRLETSRRSVVLVKPAEGVCTAEAYKRFDAAPRPVPQDVLVCDLAATRADDVVLANNLAPAAEAPVARAALHSRMARGTGGQRKRAPLGQRFGHFRAGGHVCRGQPHRHGCHGSRLVGAPTSLSGLRAAVVPGR